MTEEIVPGVHAIELGIVNAFVLVDEVVTLIDTGLPRSGSKIDAALADLGRDEVANVALTHHHPDHMGRAADLSRRGATVFVHPLDAPVVRGDREAPKPKGLARRVLIGLVGPLLMGKPESVAVDTEILDGDQVPGTSGLRAIHTPGHTAGHVSYLHPDKRILFVGDAARHASGLTDPPLIEDPGLMRGTLMKIAELDFDTAVFGHGKVLRGKANAAFRAFAESYTR